MTGVALAVEVPVEADLAFFAPQPAPVRVERILRIQGYSDLSVVRPAILNAATAMAALALELSTPSVAYRRVRVLGTRDGVLELVGRLRFHCKVFERTLRDCTEVIPFVLTVGHKLDARVIEFANSGELLDALLLETAGWLCIEDATRQFKFHLREESLARGYRITSRLGPGYSYKIGAETCTWSLEEQRPLFAAIGQAGLPVSLMSSCAMQPKMSRSGLFGLAPLASGAQPISHAYPFGAVRTT